MPYPRPTLTQLQQQAQQDILGAAIPGVSAFLRFSVLGVLTWALSGLAWLHYGYLDWISLQSVPWTATDEFLAAWMALKGVLRKGPTTATGSAIFAASASGSIASGVTMSGQSGATFVTTAAASSSGNSVEVPIAATVAGSAGNTPIGATLTLLSPIEGVTSVGTASTDIEGGADQEEDSDLRARGLAAYAAPVGGGKATDYVSWAEDVPGITRAWCNPNGFGAGTVVVYVMLDEAEAATNGFPVGTNGVAAAEERAAAATGDQLTVANAIYGQQPVTALVYVCAPTPDPIAFSITGLGTGNTAANQAAIQAALADMFLRLGSATGCTIEPDDWEAALLAISGLSQFTVASPAAAVSIPVGSLPTVGAVSFAS